MYIYVYICIYICIYIYIYIHIQYERACTADFSAHATREHLSDVDYKQMETFTFGEVHLAMVACTVTVSSMTNILT